MGLGAFATKENKEEEVKDEEKLKQSISEADKILDNSEPILWLFIIKYIYIYNIIIFILYIYSFACINI